MKVMLHLGKRYLPDEKGTTAIPFALTLLAAICMIGAAVDYSLSSTYRRRMQFAADAGALAAVRHINDQGASSASLTQIANNYINTDAAMPLSVTSVISPNISSGTVSVVLTANYPTSFMKLARINTVALKVASSAAAPTSCHTDTGGNDIGGASGLNFVLSNNETVVLPDMNGKTMTVSGWGTVEFSHDANGATLIVDSSCIGVNTVGHDFNGSTFVDNYTPPNMNFVTVTHSCNQCTFRGGSLGSGGVFFIDHDANGSSFTFNTCSTCSANGSSGSANLALTE